MQGTPSRYRPGLVDARSLTRRVPSSLKEWIPALRKREALRREVRRLRKDVHELEARLDHERLFPAEWANRRVRDHFGKQVQAGPFRGMRYPDWAFAQVDLFAPKLLGSYERELHGAIERLIARSPDVVVDVGAADGYYAVGLALRLPAARIVAFDPNQERLDQLAEIAGLNGVRERVETVSADCDPETLERSLSESSAVVCDCDGAEADLLDPGCAPRLRSVPLLVEAHDLLLERVTERLTHAFEPSHGVSVITAETRFVDDFPQLSFLPLATQQLAITEFRGGPMWWLEMIPRAVPR